MHPYLYRPITWRRAGRCVHITDTSTLTMRELAMLIRLRLATMVEQAPEGEN